MQEIDWLNRKIKEREHTTYNYLKRHLTNLAGFLIIEMLYAAVFWINRFPAPNSISTTIIPQDILTGMKLHFSCHCLLEIGGEVHNNKDGDNSMESRTTKVLSLWSTGNYQYGH